MGFFSVVLEVQQKSKAVKVQGWKSFPAHGRKELNVIPQNSLEVEIPFSHHHSNNPGKRRSDLKKKKNRFGNFLGRKLTALLHSRGCGGRGGGGGYFLFLGQKSGALCQMLWCLQKADWLLSDLKKAGMGLLAIPGVKDKLFLRKFKMCPLKFGGGTQRLASVSHWKKSKCPRLVGGDCKKRENRSIVAEAVHPFGRASICVYHRTRWEAARLWTS